MMPNLPFLNPPPADDADSAARESNRLRAQHGIVGAGGEGFSNFGHPTEVQDVYRELGYGATALALPPLPHPLNPPIDDMRLPDTLDTRAKKLWEWTEFTLTGAGSVFRWSPSDTPEVYAIAVDNTPNSRILVYLAADPAGVRPFRLGIGGELIVPANGRWLCVVSTGAGLANVSVKAIAGWPVYVCHNFGL